MIIFCYQNLVNCLSYINWSIISATLEDMNEECLNLFYERKKKVSYKEEGHHFDMEIKKERISQF